MPVKQSTKPSLEIIVLYMQESSDPQLSKAAMTWGQNLSHEFMLTDSGAVGAAEEETDEVAKEEPNPVAKNSHK